MPEYPYHLPPPNPPDDWEAVLAWKCARCGQWINEYRPIADDGVCQPGNAVAGTDGVAP